MSIMLFPEHACVFIRVRKTGSTTVVRSLLGGRGAATVIGYDGCWRPEFDGLFSFAFARNPFDRLVSCLRMFQVYPVETAAEAALRERLDLDAVMDVLEDDRIAYDTDDYRAKLRLHALPMTHPLYAIDRAQFIGAFETFEDDYRRVADRLGLAVDAVPHRRRTDAVPYRDWYDADTRARARRLLGRDLDRFGYEFGSDAPAARAA